MIPFEEVKMSSRQYEVFVMLLEGVPLTDISVRIGVTAASLQNAMSRLLRVLKAPLPPEIGYYHLMAQEFMRRQQQILDEQVKASIAGRSESEQNQMTSAERAEKALEEEGREFFRMERVSRAAR